jgi:hypothetical protein
LGSGISRSTSSNGPFAFETCTARIFLAMNLNRPSLQKDKANENGSRDAINSK